MPDISTLLEKADKKKFKKSTYRPWNYLDEIEKEQEEKKEELISNQTSIESNESIVQQEKSEPINLTPSVELNLNTANVIEPEASLAIPSVPPKAGETHKEQSNSPLYSIFRLSGHQKVIFTYIMERCSAREQLSSGIITSETLTNITQTTLYMINTSIQRLVEKKLISRENGKRGRGGFFCFSLSESVRDAAIEHQRLSTEENKRIGVNHSQVNDYPKSVENSRHDVLNKEYEDIDIEPLQHIGFSKSHLVQLQKQSSVERNALQDSIYHYAFDLQYNNKAAEIKKSTPIGFFMGILMRTGLYNPPENYESPKDKALRELLQRKKAEKEKRDSVTKELLNLAFDEWHEKLSKEEKDKIIPEDIRNGRINAPKLASLRSYFTDKVWPEIAPKELGL